MRVQLISVAVLALVAGMIFNQPQPTTASYSQSVGGVESLQRLSSSLDELDTLLVDYRARWTHPEPLTEHMQAHGVDPAGMTREDMQRTHDDIHDVIGPVAAGHPIPHMQTVSYQQDCPGGVCPVPVQRAAAVVRAAVQPMRTATSYGSTGYSTVQSYGSTGYSVSSASAANYGSGGGYSQAAASGPVRRVFSTRPVRRFAAWLFGR